MIKINLYINGRRVCTFTTDPAHVRSTVMDYCRAYPGAAVVRADKRTINIFAGDSE